MSWREIRPIALGLVWRDDELLLQRYDGEETFYRPLGGGLEFEERARDALVREFREELDREVTPIEQLGVLENVFTFEGTPGHEVVFVFEAEFADDGAYEQETFEGLEDDGPGRFTASWEPVSQFIDGEATLYPDGLVGLLDD
ncbi:NUDIX hydrolase [Haloarchaeobius sp. HME9146]|uniref:NUDIX hydrolase n=1 Tax=Haloarchaeobius sp. HME9146 TaxID=2978732 RepID=UPI0021BE7CE1|nr:NUDIX domain-containing protein [Haloarchaeobius sp. HME9146]MCT9097442.1 NUDIX domain-containing protein [Haloarchaeobius sp. HME9146]